MADEGRILTPKTLLAGDSQRFLSRPDFFWLQRDLCARDRAHRFVFWNCCNEPVPLVVTAQKLLLGQKLPLRAELTAEQKQVLFPWLHVQNDDLLLAAGSCPDLVVFTELVSTNVENNARCILARREPVPATDRGNTFQNPHTCAHPGKVSVQITAHCFFLSKAAYRSRNVLTDRSLAPSLSRTGDLTARDSCPASFPFSFGYCQKNCWTGTFGQGTLGARTTEPLDFSTQVGIEPTPPAPEAK